MLNGLDKIEGLTPEQQQAINDLAGGQSNKINELLGKLSESKGSIGDGEAAKEELRLLKSSIEQKGLEEKQHYQESLSLRDKDHAANIEKLTNESKADKSLIHELLVSKGLLEEMTALGVDPVKVPRLVKSFESEATIVDGKAMIGDKSLSDYMNEWGETDEGKSYIVGQQNSNSGGLGGGKAAQGKTMAEMSESERVALYQSNPALFNQLKQAM
ncbi:MAG: hypothetical protein GY738_12880 [Pseudoalteromonas sp.]|nr:hypothetical protein [Pseudoalteromonas sp.]